MIVYIYFLKVFKGFRRRNKFCPKEKQIQIKLIRIRNISKECKLGKLLCSKLK